MSSRDLSSAHDADTGGVEGGRPCLISFHAFLANLEQQHKLAKDLLRETRNGDPAALARLKAVHSDAGVTRPLLLADAQLAIAREAGFDSWPMLVQHLQHRDIKAFRDAVSHGDVATVTRLLGLPHVKEHVNTPMFAFGQRAAHIAAKRASMLEALIAAGANLNLMSEWENGPYTVLDNATEETARFLLARGVKLTPNVAARLGWVDLVQQRSSSIEATLTGLPTKLAGYTSMRNKP